MTSAGSVRSGEEGGIESQPVSVAYLPAAMFAAPGAQSSAAWHFDNFLPASGPPGTQQVVFVPRQTLSATLASEGVGNAVDSRAVDFRKNRDDPSTTIGVVLVAKTPGNQAYWHEYAGCARFHGWILIELRAARVEVGGARGQPAWFWYSVAQQEASGRQEHAIQFCVFVSERRRELLVDSRWIAKQYCRHWRDPRRPFDYVLNYQIWSYSKECSFELLREVLAKLTDTKGSWRLSFANQQEPSPSVPGVFIAAAWIDDRGEVCLALTNRGAERRLVCFHGTKRLSRDDQQDIFFPEQWHPVRPGLNFVRLPLGPMHNAVVYAEADGFLDKAFVNTDVVHPWQGRPAPTPPAVDPQPKQAPPRLTISWPPDNARVAVLKDHIDLPGNKDDDFRVAVTGTVPGGTSPRYRIAVDVGTDSFYAQETVVVDGLWGCRVYLCGDDKEQHKIRVQVRDGTRRVVEEKSVAGIRRLGR